MFKMLKKKHIIYASLLIGIFSLFIFCTIAYSAINGTIKISGDAYARAEADARITDFRLASSNNATSSYEEFGKNHIVTEIDLINSSSSITYYVEVTNYGSSDVGIFDITGLPSGLNYSLKEYNLKDKICDSNGLCNTFIKKTFEIIFTSSSAFSGSVQLNFDIRPFFKISYIDLTGNYPTEFLAGSQVSIDISYDYPEFAYAVGEDDFGYTYSDGIIHFAGVWCDVEIGSIVSKSFSYTGDVQTYKVKADGIYKIDLWGAQGGNNGGLGGYTSGYVQLHAKDDLYFYVGGLGKTSISESHTLIQNEFNSGTGTTGQQYNPSRYWGTGGGATDVRLVGGTWNSFSSLKSRIMVAGSGGGRYIGDGSDIPGGSAGGLVGYDGQPAKLFEQSGYGSAGYGAKQTSAGYCVVNNILDPLYEKNAWSLGEYCKGGFGYGGVSELTFAYAGGGNGYYGGGASTHVQSAGGGSSFISWHEGCDAITESSTSSNIVHTGQSVHYSGYVFANTTMIDGDGYKWVAGKKGSGVVGMIKPDYSGVANGNEGNGYARITPLKLGEYKLISYKGTSDSIINYQHFITPGEDLTVSFQKSYADVIVKNKNGNEYNNYSYDVNNKILTVYDVNDDIEVYLIGSFDVSQNLSVSDSSITVNVQLKDVCTDCFPVEAKLYYKKSNQSDDNYNLFDTVTINDTSLISRKVAGLPNYTSYDAKIVLTGANGYTKTVYASGTTLCFASGTKVLVENGYKNIEDIQVGDYVYALDLEFNERVLKKVIDKYEGYTDETYGITVNGETIIATPRHQFYVIDKGWVRAYELEVGDRLNSIKNGNPKITDISRVLHKDLISVYNLTVEDLHNYLITNDQLLVHNYGSK